MRRRVVMVGSGWIAPKHVRAWLANGVEVVAVVANDLPQARRLCEATGISPRLCESVESLLATDFNFVDLLVPPQHSASLLVRLAPGGKPILCEKPVGLSVAECESMFATARAHRAPLMAMHNELFYPLHVRAREIIASGEIGEPKLLRTHLVGHHSAIGGWKDVLVEKGGMIWDDGIHRIYTAEYLMGEIISVAGVQRRLFDDPGEGLSGSVNFAFREARMGVMDFSYRLGGAEFYDDSLTVFGTTGVIQVNGCYTAALPMPRLCVRSGASTIWRSETIEDAWESSFVHLVRHFIECVESGVESPLIGERAVVRVIRVAEAIERSFAAQREIILGTP